MKYLVLQPVKHDGKRRAPGSEIDLSQKEAVGLVAAGVIEKATDAKATKLTQAQLDALAADDAAKDAKALADKAAKDAADLAAGRVPGADDGAGAGSGSADGSGNGSGNSSDNSEGA